MTSAEPQQVEGGREGVQLAVAEDRDARRPRLQLDADLLAQRRHVDVAREQVVVVALEQHPVADVDCRRLATEARPALVDVGLVAELRKPVGGGEAGGAGAEDGDSHRRGRLPGRRAVPAKIPAPVATLHVSCSCASDGAYAPHSAAMLDSVLANAGGLDVRVHYLHGPGLPARTTELIEGMVADRGGSISFTRRSPTSGSRDCRR